MRGDVADMRGQPWWGELPPSIRTALERLDPQCEVPDLDEFRAMRFSFWQPIDLYQMLEGARAKAEELGFRAVILSSHLAALSEAAATVLAHIAHECEQYGQPFKPPVALITGGHLDVAVGDASGVGGRNQEFALVWGRSLGRGRLASKRIVVAAMDSDGTDGPGIPQASAESELLCMAGGVVDGCTWDEAAGMAMDVDAELANHNSTVALMRRDTYRQHRYLLG
jgi:glycerate 2-kinase